MTFEPSSPHFFIEVKARGLGWIRSDSPALPFEAAVMKAKQMAAVERRSMRLVKAT